MIKTKDFFIILRKIKSRFSRISGYIRISDYIRRLDIRPNPYPVQPYYSTVFASGILYHLFRIWYKYWFMICMAVKNVHLCKDDITPKSAPIQLHHTENRGGGLVSTCPLYLSYLRGGKVTLVFLFSFSSDANGLICPSLIIILYPPLFIYTGC